MTHEEIMRHLQEVHDNRFPRAKKEVGITGVTVRDYISIGICYGVEMDDIREYLKKHSRYDEERIRQEISQCRAEMAGAEARNSCQNKPLVFSGRTYGSLSEAAKKTGIKQSLIDYAIQTGRARYL